MHSNLCLKYGRHWPILVMFFVLVLTAEGQEDTDESPPVAEEGPAGGLSASYSDITGAGEPGLPTDLTDDDRHKYSDRPKRAVRNSGDHKKSKSKKKENRRKLAISAVEKIVEQSLSAHLQPLATALKLIRIDTFSEGILRQLSSLELIQSKLLTEYGELRGAVNEVGRHTLDLGRQVAGLDERLAALDRQLPHRMDIAAHRNDYRSDSMTRTSSSFNDLSQTTEILKDALVAITTKITSCERGLKEELSVIGNRTSDSIKSSQNYLDRRIAEVAMDTEQVLASVEKMMNRSCCATTFPSSSYSPSSSSFSSSSSSFSPSDRFFRRPLSGGHAPHLLKSTPPQGGDTPPRNDDLVYLPAEEKSLISGRLEREERQHPPLITPFSGWMRPVASSSSSSSSSPPTSASASAVVTELQLLSHGTVTRLATEIAKHLAATDADLSGPRDCGEVAARGETKSGIYTIHPASCTRRFAVKVWCELSGVSTGSSEGGGGGGGWTVIQRRGPWNETPGGSSSSPQSAPPSFLDASSTPAPSPVDFFRDWAQYKWGFGNLDGEYWLGNEYIHHLTQSGDYDLRIELHDWSSEVRWAQYAHFAIDGEASNYTLHIGEYTGTAGNSLKHHEGVAFSTRDRDHDSNPRGHCARTYHGAWWFTSCHESHLNGRYHKGRHKIFGDGMNWTAFRGYNYSLKKSRMMIKAATRHG